MKKVFTIFFTVFLMFSFPGEGSQVVASTAKKTLTIGISQEFETMNPITMTMFATSYVIPFAMHPLISVDETWQPRCYLCKTVPTLENGLAKIIEENGKKKMSIEWEIKDSAKWNDGTPITGRDMITGWQIGSSPHVMVEGKEQYTRIEDIVVDPANPKKFTMKLKEATFDFASIGDFYPVPAHLEGPIWTKTKDEIGAYEKQTTFLTSPYQPGLYSGPFFVKEIRAGSHVVFEKNPHFYGEPAKFDQVVIKLIPDTATLEANLISGTIDMICELGLFLDQALAFEKRVQNDPNLKSRYQVFYRDGASYEHIDINLTTPLMQDVRLRQALVYAIDRDKLVQALFEGKQKKAIHNLHPLDPHFSDQVVLYEYNPVRADELLDQAGWKKGADGYRHKDGQKLSLVFMTTAQNKTRELVQVFLQEQWKKVGVEVQIRNEPGRVFFSETLNKMKYPHLALYTWLSGPGDPQRNVLHSREISTPENNFVGSNHTGWRNTKADALLDQVFVEFDREKRRQLMQQVLLEYTKEVPAVPLYYRAELAVIPTALKNYHITGHKYPSSLKANEWQWQ